MVMTEMFDRLKFFTLFKVAILNEIYAWVYGITWSNPILACAFQVGYEIALLTIISRILEVELFAAEVTEYTVVVLLHHLTKWIHEIEPVTICYDFDCTRHLSTWSVGQELTNATYLGKAVAILATEFTSELDLLKDGNEFMLVTIFRFCSPTGSAFDVKAVEIASIAMVEEASFATPIAGFTKLRPWWHFENKGVVWMQRVLYLTG